MRRRGSMLVVAAIVLAGTNACNALGRSSFANPIVELRDVRLRGVGMEGGTLDVILDVYNPNDYRLDASKVTYRLFVDTTQLAVGEVNKLVTLENGRKTAVTLPVSFTTLELFGAAALMTRNGSLDYRVTGEVTVATPFGSFTRPYEGKGRFDSLKP